MIDDWECEIEDIHVSFKVGNNKIISVTKKSQTYQSILLGAKQARISDHSFHKMLLEQIEKAEFDDSVIKTINYLEKQCQLKDAL